MTKETQIVIEGDTYILKPSFKVLEAIETATGITTAEIPLSCRSFSAKHFARILHSALVASGTTDFSYDELGEMLAEDYHTENQAMIAALMNFAMSCLPQGLLAKVNAGKKPSKRKTATKAG